MNKLLFFFIPLMAIALFGFKNPAKWVSKNGHISFYSHTPVEDITANNYKVVSTLDESTGDYVFSVPMQSFEFKKALMQQHFNGGDFLDTKTYPKAKFVGKIENIGTVNFAKDGTYNVTVKGTLTIKDISKPVTEKGTIKVAAGKVIAHTKMKVVLADYNITFAAGKPSTNISKEIEVTVDADYSHE